MKSDGSRNFTLDMVHYLQRNTLDMSGFWVQWFRNMLVVFVVGKAFLCVRNISHGYSSHFMTTLLSIRVQHEIDSSSKQLIFHQQTLTLDNSLDGLFMDSDLKDGGFWKLG